MTGTELMSCDDHDDSVSVSAHFNSVPAPQFLVSLSMDRAGLAVYMERGDGLS